MTHTKKIALGFFLISMVGTSFAATLFEDAFQDSAATKTKWIFPAAVSRQFIGGMLNVQNTDTGFLWNVSHSFSSKAATFSLSATITLSLTGTTEAGLGFCMTGSDGIYLWLGHSQNAYVFQGNTLLFNTSNSFISQTVNAIVVSKKDSVFNLFCNNRFIGSFTSATSKYSGGGDIAIAVAAKSSFQVDNILMTDQFTPGVQATTYSNNFASGTTQGLYVAGVNGTASVSAGTLTIANSGLTPANPYVNGNFNQASMKVIVTHKQGDGFYGLAFYNFAPGPQGDTIKSYLFLVNAARYYGSALLGGASIASMQTSIVTGSTDTLEVLRFSNKYKFSINGAVMADSFPLPEPGKIDAAGLYVGAQTTVAFEDFALGGDSTGNFSTAIIQPKQNKGITAPRSKFFSNDIAFFDLRGRSIGHSKGNYLETMKRLPGGMYIMRSVEENAVRASPGLRLK